MVLILLVLVTLVLAAANGANDNIKGAATLVGSGLVGHRGAIALATLATAVGGVASIYVANGLLVFTPLIGGLYALIDHLWIFGEERRCLHDKIADTVVVKA